MATSRQSPKLDWKSYLTDEERDLFAEQVRTGKRYHQLTKLKKQAYWRAVRRAERALLHKQRPPP